MYRLYIFPVLIKVPSIIKFLCSTHFVTTACQLIYTNLLVGFGEIIIQIIKLLNYKVRLFTKSVLSML